MKRFLLIMICMCCAPFAWSQTSCSFVIADASTHKPIDQAVVFVDEGEAILSGSSGHVLFICSDVQRITVQTLMCDTTITITNNNFPDTVFLSCAPFELDAVSVLPKDAKFIVQSAVKKIPVNYSTSSFVLYGFFRTYKNVNGYFRELTEANIGTLFQVNDENTYQNVDEAFGIQNIRRTKYTLPISEFYDRQLEDLFRQNLIYHNAYAAFNDLYIDKTLFSIDTAASTDSTWFIRYAMQHITGENHGIDNYIPEQFAGEGTETGYFIIHKTDLAFLTIQRECVRNPKYAYPGHNNFLHPDMRYTGELNEGFLEVVYVKHEGLYYPKQIMHAFANTFTFVPTNQVSWRITEYAEWHSDSLSAVISSELMEALKTYDSDLRYSYTYDPMAWQHTAPWYFVRKEQVFEDLKLLDTPEQLFIKGGQ